jgi:NADPH-dependent 2,4-dienoyl-CoA reductase/sulfur reductase-like enzyme
LLNFLVDIPNDKPPLTLNPGTTSRVCSEAVQHHEESLRHWQVFIYQLYVTILTHSGAGPSGLVAAKTLTHDHKGVFHVTVFEQLNRIGGLWPVSTVDDGMVHPDMCTNQSKHTVSFSDLAWPEASPHFPKAWQVGQYLERYIEKYPGYEIKLNTRVNKTDYLGGKWRIHIEEALGKPQALEFDHLIVATGFFGQPKQPKTLQGGDLCRLASSRYLLTQF